MNLIWQQAVSSPIKDSSRATFLAGKDSKASGVLASLMLHDCFDGSITDEWKVPCLSKSPFNNFPQHSLIRRMNIKPAKRPCQSRCPRSSISSRPWPADRGFDHRVQDSRSLSWLSSGISSGGDCWLEVVGLSAMASTFCLGRIQLVPEGPSLRTVSLRFGSSRLIPGSIVVIRFSSWCNFVSNSLR